MNAKKNTNITGNIIITIFIIICSLSLFRCANIARPTGGPKDSIPPEVLSENPPNYTTNFNSKKISIQFDEYIKFNNQNKEFSISPDLEKQPQYKIKKKFLEITLPDSLEDNTTYTINLGNGLVDYNEGNPIKNYTYVFSTGPELDSLTISGSVKNAFTKQFDEKVDNDVRVLLIPISQDSIFGKKKANIYTSVDTSGNFIFRNLREDTYRIYAIKEQNNDRIYNNPEESIGFIADSLVLNKNIDNIKIEYSKGKPETFRTLERKVQKDGHILLVFNQALNNPKLTILDSLEYEKTKIVKYSHNKDSAFMYIEKLNFDSLKIQISDNQKVIDTTLLRRSKNEKYERTIEPQFNITNKVDKIKHITINSNTPIKEIIKDKIVLKEDSIERKNYQLQQDSLENNKYHIRFNWKPKKNYELVLEEKAINGYFEEYNPETKLSFTLNDDNNYGDIILTLNNLEPNQQYIVELIDDKKTKVYDRSLLKDNNKIAYLKYPAGKYSIRIIKDINENGRWDPVDIYQKIQAEPIWYMDKSFTIRPNWEQTETLNIEFD